MATFAVTAATSTWTTRNTELHTWFERDRAHVELRGTATGNTILEWWDEAVQEAIEDGFLLPGRRMHESAVDYANWIGA